MVVGVLVQGPVTVHDVAGVDVTAAEMILHRLTVLAELHHLALEVGPLVDAYAVGALPGLETDSGVKYKIRTALQLSTAGCGVALYFSVFCIKI